MKGEKSEQVVLFSFEDVELNDADSCILAVMML
jgi:hypothetical protein